MNANSGTSLLRVAGIVALAAFAPRTQASAPNAPATISQVGAQATTTDGLDAYGDEIGLDRVIRARATQEEIVAETVRIDEMARSAGYRLDADTTFEVLIAEPNGDLKVRVLRGFDHTWDGFVAWVSAADAAAVIR